MNKDTDGYLVTKNLSPTYEVNRYRRVPSNIKLESYLKDGFLKDTDRCLSPKDYYVLHTGLNYSMS